MADLPSILGGMAQGFIDFGKGAVDLFGTGGAAIGDLVDTIKTGKVSTKNQDDFRKWLYNTDSVEDAAAKGLGTALNGVQTVTDYIPGIGAVTKNPLFNAGQGALGGLADEFKTYGKDYDLGRAGERAAVSAGAALASGSLGDALKKSANPLLSSGTVQGLTRGATGGAITGGGYAAIDGGDIAQGALQGAGTGALIGGATGAIQDFKPAKTYDLALTDDERQARIANAKNMLANEQNPERIAELNEQIKKYGGATAQPDYLGDEKYSKLVKKAKNYKTLDRFEKMNNPIKGSEIWGEKPKSYFERDSRAVRINMFPNDATKGTGLTKQYLLNMFKDAYDEGITDIVPSYGSYTKEGASFMNHLADQGWVKQNGRNGYNSYEIAPKIAEWQKTNPLADIYNVANSTTPKALENTLADVDNRQAQFDLLQKTNPMMDDYHTGIRSPEDIRTLKSIVDSYNADNNFTYPDFTLADAQKALASGNIDVYSSKPIEAGAFISPSKMMATDYAGGGEVYTKNIPLRDFAFIESGDEGNYLPTARALETTLADADMAVNNPRTFYHGNRATPSESGDTLGSGLYITSNKDRASGYADGGNVSSYDISNLNIANLDDVIPDNVAKVLKDNPELAAKLKTLTPTTESYGLDQKDVAYDLYKKLQQELPRDQISVRKTDSGYDITYPKDVDYSKITGKDLFRKLYTPEAQDVFMGAGYDGVSKTALGGDTEIAVYRNAPKPLEDVLATDDMAVNSAKIAPGQLGLFDDMPTQAPKTAGRQTSLFDQPQEGVDYYGDDIEMPATKPTNPYAPVDGQVTQAMRDRAADILGNWKKNGVPENELYNAINPDTLPLGYKEAIDVLDNMDAKKYLKDNLGVTDIKKAKFDKVLDYLFGDNEDAKRARIEMRDQQIESAKQKAKLLGLPGPSKNFVPTVEAQLREEVEYKMAKDIAKSLKDIPVDAQTGEVMPLASMNLERLDPKKHSFRTGYTAAADEALSERLGIAPGNTPKYNGKMDVRGAYGRYQHPFYGAGGDVAVFERKMSSPEDAISSIAHERLHSFQNEANNEFNRAGRYSKEVQDAYNDLHKDLESFKKTPQETAKRYGRSQYWQQDKEQEARMLEVYLENRGYANAPNMQNRYRKGEWGDEINPAFDKFFDKLRDLSKRGVALPALTALFGGGAYMASQDNDKEKEVK